MRIKILTLLTGLFLFSNLTFAQSVGEYRVRKTETVTRKIEKPKKQLAPQRQFFFIMPEVAVGKNFDFALSYDINGVFGYVFNNHFALGIGIGYNSCTIQDSCTIQGRKATCIPFYLNLHGDFKVGGDFSKNKVSPYYSLDLGYRKSLNSVIRSNFFYKLKGPIISPELGLRFNNCYIGANLIIGYSEYSYYSSYSTDSKMDYIINLKFGYKILLKM